MLVVGGEQLQAGRRDDAGRHPSRLEPIKRCARTLKERAQGLLNYFEHRITNALCEGFNSKIQQLKAAARGFRNFDNYRVRILFFCGSLHLSP